MLTPDQFIASQKANLDAFNDLSLKMFNSAEKLAKLNFATAKAALVDSHEHAQAMLSAKDLQELLSLQNEMAQPLAQKSVNYGREVYEIFTQTGTEFSKVVESKVEENREQFADFVDNAVKSAPAGSEAATTMIKNAVAAANNAFDSMQKAVKQASDVAEANFNAAAENVSKVAKTTATTARSKKS